MGIREPTSTNRRQNTSPDDDLVCTLSRPRPLLTLISGALVDSAYNYEYVHSWVLYDIYGPLTRQLMASLAEDSIPAGAPVDYNPRADEDDGDHPLLEKLGEMFHAR